MMANPNDRGRALLEDLLASEPSQRNEVFTEHLGSLEPNDALNTMGRAMGLLIDMHAVYLDVVVRHPGVALEVGAEAEKRSDEWIQNQFEDIRRTLED